MFLLSVLVLAGAASAGATRPAVAPGAFGRRALARYRGGAQDEPITSTTTSSIEADLNSILSRVRGGAGSSANGLGAERELASGHVPESLLNDASRNAIHERFEALLRKAQVSFFYC